MRSELPNERVKDNRNELKTSLCDETNVNLQTGPLPRTLLFLCSTGCWAVTTLYKDAAFSNGRDIPVDRSASLRVRISAHQLPGVHI